MSRYAVVPAQALDDTRLGPAALRVLLEYGRYADTKGWCYPKQSTIADGIGCGRQAVQNQVAKLKRLGYLERGAQLPGGAYKWRVRLDLADLPAEFDRRQLTAAGRRLAQLEDELAFQGDDDVTPDVSPPLTPDVSVTPPGVSPPDTSRGVTEQPSEQPKKKIAGASQPAMELDLTDPTPPPSKRKTERQRDPVVDALAEAFNATTAGELKRCGIAAAALKKAGLTDPDEIRARARRARELWDAPSPMVVPNAWGRLQPKVHVPDPCNSYY